MTQLALNVPEGSYADVISQETIQLMQQRLQDPTMTRNINTTTGLIGYDLQGPAAVVVPVDTPLVNQTARINNADRAADRHHWKAIQTFGWNAAASPYYPGTVDQFATAPDLPYTVLDLFNTFQSIATDQEVSIQQQIRGTLLEGDVKARRFSELIYALKLTEENWLTNGSDFSWAPAVPLNPTAGTAAGATIANNTYYVGVSAVTQYANATFGETYVTGCRASVTVTAGGTGTISCTFFTVPNAIKYNVYVGTSSTPSSWHLQPAASFSGGAAPTQSVLNMNGNASFTLVAYDNTGAAPPVANTAMLVQSASAYGSTPLTFNGLMALVFGAGNQYYTGGIAPGIAVPTPSSSFTAAGLDGSTVAASGGLGTTTMTPNVIQPAASSGKLSYADIKTLLLLMYNKARARPDRMWVSPQDNQTVTDLLYNSNNSRVVITPSPEGTMDLVAGARVGGFVNPTTNSMVEDQYYLAA